MFLLHFYVHERLFIALLKIWVINRLIKLFYICSFFCFLITLLTKRSDQVLYWLFTFRTDFVSNNSLSLILDDLIIDYIPRLKVKILTARYLLFLIFLFINYSFTDLGLHIIISMAILQTGPKNHRNEEFLNLLWRVLNEVP